MNSEKLGAIVDNEQITKKIAEDYKKKPLTVEEIFRRQHEPVEIWLKDTKKLALKFGDEVKEEFLGAVHYGLIQGWFACYAYTHGEKAAKQLYAELFDVSEDKVYLATDCPVSGGNRKII